MINSKELRIGNYLLSNTSDWVTVESILSSTMRIYGHYEGDDNEEYLADFSQDDLSPIPLTAEILEKCGFVHDKNGWYKISYTAFNASDYDDLIYHLIEHDVEISVNIKSNWVNIHNITHDEQGATSKNRIKYLHQLQNLIHALTGEELKHYTEWKIEK